MSIESEHRDEDFRQWKKSLDDRAEECSVTHPDPSPVKSELACIQCGCTRHSMRCKTPGCPCVRIVVSSGTTVFDVFETQDFRVCSHGRMAKYCEECMVDRCKVRIEGTMRSWKEQTTEGLRNEIKSWAASRHVSVSDPQIIEFIGSAILATGVPVTLRTMDLIWALWCEKA